MAVRRFHVRVESKDRMRVACDILIVTEPGTLMQNEIERLKATLADKVMVALTEVPYLNAHVSQIKVSR
jgi:hypothetical protein